MGNFYTDVISKSSVFNSTGRCSDLNLLEPVTLRKTNAIIADAAAHGRDLMVFETYRSQARQAMLFEQGATKLRHVGTHHYGIAADIVYRINGEPSWKGDFEFIGHLVKAHNMVWGGDWHSFPDYAHAQRITVARQASVFSGLWYPSESYDPIRDG